MRIHFILHVPFEGPGSIIDWAVEKNYPVSFTRTDEQMIFPPLDQFDLLIIMGGPMAVYDEETFPWIAEEKKFIHAAIDSAKKVLGICLGSQLIASVLGAEVYPHVRKETGWWPVEKTRDHFLLEGIPAKFTAFHLHGDTFDLPPGAVQLFKSHACAQQGFAFKDHVAGLQFHPEIEISLLLNMLEHEEDDLSGGESVQTLEEIRKAADVHLALQKMIMATILENFT